ncbi:hypothetical protein DXH78_12145 [Undibacter mobilis]|uniref:Uncharacterized protein n=1 Tax=Undibacter mobilis TaxID=2292256 RepID=A0A371BCF2_9BRAD|nr:hypothetical protein DXH78_12145 [Undibacter mobilis]
MALTETSPKAETARAVDQASMTSRAERAQPTQTIMQALSALEAAVVNSSMRKPTFRPSAEREATA